jgi:DNA-binding transcriptional LysR family regulator
MNKTASSQLLVFKTIVEMGSIARAANVLAVSRSSIIRSVRGLETVFNAKLLEHSPGRNAQATPAGYKAYQFALVFDQLGRLVGHDEAAKLWADPQIGRLAIGAHDFIADTHLPALTGEFAKRRSGVEIGLRRGRTSEIVQLVRDGAVDLGFVLVAVNEKIDGLSSESIGQERLAIFAVPGHPLANRSAVSCDEASVYAFVMPGGGETADDKRILKLLSRMGLKDARPTVSSGEGAWYGLGPRSSDLCLAICSRVTAEIERSDLIEVDVDTAPIFFDVQVIWRDDWDMSATSRAFLRFVRSRQQRAELSR